MIGVSTLALLSLLIVAFTITFTVPTPFFLNHGRHPHTPLSYAIPTRASNPAVSEWVAGMQSALLSAKSNKR